MINVVAKFTEILIKRKQTTGKDKHIELYPHQIEKNICLGRQKRNWP